MCETWRNIADHPSYQVSNSGRVINKNTNRLLKPRADRKGYLRVYLYNSTGKPVDRLVHRLVAEAFHGGKHPDLDVNHIDGRKNNNSSTNLEWCTRSENLKHCYRNGLRNSPHNRCKPVRIVETGEVFDSVRSCARYLGCEHSNISLCLHGIQKSCKGYHFEFCD